MLFSTNWLQEFFKTKLPAPEKLADLLEFHAFEVEGLEKKRNDWVLDLAILPHRGDCMSHEGIAREISAMTDKELIAPQGMELKAQKGNLAPLKVSAANRVLVPRYSALVIEGVTVGPSPQWMQDRLASLGHNSLSNIVDITNYVMAELGQPLHAFDYDKIQGHIMRVREAKNGEELVLLDGHEIALEKGMLVIEDTQELIDLAGIMGGKNTAISGKTRNIVLHAAAFERQRVYQTKKSLGYSTFAAEIYSRGTDPNLTLKALQRAAFLLSTFGGGKIVQVIDLYPSKARPRELLLAPGAVEKLLGVQIPEQHLQKIFKGLGFSKKGNRLTIPTWRQDVTLPQDLIEEAGRMYGYENVKPALPFSALSIPEPSPSLVWSQQVRNTLKEQGYTEVYNYSFIGGKDLALLGYGKEDKERSIALENPISEDFSYLRASLLDNLVKNVKKNEEHMRTRDIKIFEIGKTFALLKNAKLKSGKWTERMMLGIILSSGIPQKDAPFYALKGLVDVCFSTLGVSNVWYDEFQALPDRGHASLWNPGRSAEIKIGEQEIGFLGEISSHILSNLEIKRGVFGCEVDLEALFEHAIEQQEYRPPSKFPATLRDIALLVPLQTKTEEVLNVMERAGKELVQDIDLFDIYEGSELPEGKKNLAFHIVYQAGDRTLTSQEVDSRHQEIIHALESENPEWEVRD